MSQTPKSSSLNLAKIQLLPCSFLQQKRGVRTMEAGALLRALNPLKFRPKLSGSFPIRCSSSSSSSSSSIKIPTGKEMGRRAYDGLLLDAANTLLQLTKPVEETYAVIGKKYGLTTSPAEIKQGFKRAFSAPWPENLRYQDDGRPFWKLVVSEATGCSDDTYFEEVYQHYASGEAWHLPAGAYDTILVLKRSGVKLAVVSNFDTRLRKILKDLNVLDLFDAVIISSEVGHEKPDTKIFRAALDRINVEAIRTVHVGDDEKADKGGADAAGIDCWLWGVDVKSFADIQNRILTAP